MRALLVENANEWHHMAKGHGQTDGQQQRARGPVTRVHGSRGGGYMLVWYILQRVKFDIFCSPYLSKMGCIRNILFALVASRDIGEHATEGLMHATPVVS